MHPFQLHKAKSANEAASMLAGTAVSFVPRVSPPKVRSSAPLIRNGVAGNICDRCVRTNRAAGAPTAIIKSSLRPLKSAFRYSMKGRSSCGCP